MEHTPILRRVFFAVSIALVSPCTAMAQGPPSSADGSSADEELVQEGIALRKQGRDADALVAFDRAYALRPSPRALAQIALAHQALGNWRDAERELMVVLQNSEDEWIAGYRVPLQKSLDAVRSHLAWLDVESNVAGAVAWIGGEVAGRLPLEHPIRVISGELEVRVIAPGYAAMRQTLHMESKSHSKAVFSFLVQSDIEPRPGEPDAIATVHVKSETSGRRRAGWITLAGAGGLALAGVGAMAIREVEARIYDYDSQCAPSAGRSRYDRCGTNRDIGSTAQTIGIMAIAGAAVATAISGVLLFSSSGPSGARTATHFACMPSAMGLACDASF